MPHPLRFIRNRLAWSMVIAPAAKRWWNRLSPEDKMNVLDMLPGLKTKAGTLGAYLTTAAAFLAQFAAADCHDLQCWLSFGQKEFIALGGYGLVMKVLRWWEAKHEPATKVA